MTTPSFNPLNLNPVSFSIPKPDDTAKLSPNQRETVTIVRVLAEQKDCWIFGSTTNLWLGGAPSAELIVGYFEDSARTIRGLDVIYTADGLNELVRLLEGITVRKLAVRRLISSAKLYVQVHPQLTLYFTIAAHPWDALVTDKADITANMKYVARNSLVGILPTAIEDAAEGRLIWLDTCPKGSARRYAIHEKQLRAKRALQAGFYGVCAEPPPPPPERFTGVIRGWRTYSWAEGKHKAGARTEKLPILAGDRGYVWTSGTYHGTCEGLEDITDSQHMLEHSCGVYMHTLPRVNWGDWDVYAECVGWGNVVEHSKGYRVQNARIEKIFCMSPKVSEDWVRVLKAVYDCEVVLPVMELGAEAWTSTQKLIPEYLGVPELFDDRGH